MTKTLLAISVLAILTTGCNKEKKQYPSITAKAGIRSFYASGSKVTGKTQKYSSYTSAFVEGTSADGSMVKLWIKDYTGKLDTYQLDSTQGAAAYQPPLPSVENPGSRGFVQIWTVTPRLTGIFYFKCEDSTDVLGTFDVDAI